MTLQLPDTANGQQAVSLDDVASGSKALLVLWICNHCPFVLAIIGASRWSCDRPCAGKAWQTACTQRGLMFPADGLVDVAREFEGQGLATVAISANSVKTHPQVLLVPWALLLLWQSTKGQLQMLS